MDDGGSDMINWSESKAWKENWITEEEIEGGGQATAKVVKNKDTQKRAFLKILNKQGDKERRSRFFREASLYATIKHQHIPTLIESNAHKFEDSKYSLYLITEYIEGPTLTKYIKDCCQLNFLDASTVLLNLLNVIKCCHAIEVIHRDIKPDNIILRESKVSLPILLDFGIAYKKEPDSDFKTDDTQELGNRFLRLPELSCHSTSKQDKRIDISFLGGIYYYLLTGITPSILLNEEAKMPHQRENIVAKLKQSFKGDLQELLRFFDKSFSQKLLGRFSNVEEMKTFLEILIDMHNNPDSSSTNLDIDQLLSTINSSANQELLKNKNLYDSVMDQIKAIHSQVAEQIASAYAPCQTGYINSVEGLKNSLGFVHIGNSSNSFLCSFHITAVGSELVIIGNTKPIYRTELESFVPSEEFTKLVKNIFLDGVGKLAENPEQDTM